MLDRFLLVANFNLVNLGLFGNFLIGIIFTTASTAGYVDAKHNNNDQNDERYEQESSNCEIPSHFFLAYKRFKEPSVLSFI